MHGGVYAQVVKICERTGMTGEVIQVKLRVMDGIDKGRILTRNIKGPVKLNDIIVLRDTSTEAIRLRTA